MSRSCSAKFEHVPPPNSPTVYDWWVSLTKILSSDSISTHRSTDVLFLHMRDDVMTLFKIWVYYMSLMDDACNFVQGCDFCFRSLNVAQLLVLGRAWRSLFYDLLTSSSGHIWVPSEWWVCTRRRLVLLVKCCGQRRQKGVGSQKSYLALRKRGASFVLQTCWDSGANRIGLSLTRWYNTYVSGQRGKH